MQVTGDAVVEPDETFTVALGALTLPPGIDPAAVTVAGSPANGTILDDDAGVSGATLEATKAAATAGSFLPGATVVYTIVLGNSGPGDQADNPGDELVDVLPPELVLVSAGADTGGAVADPGSNTVTWNGALAAGASATITIEAEIAAGVPLGTTVANQAALAFDADNDGSNEASGLSDDPAAPGAADPTTFAVAAQHVPAIPTLDEVALLLLAAAFAGAALLALRRH